jgi:hypothetical protein
MHCAASIMQVPVWTFLGKPRSTSVHLSDSPHGLFVLSDSSSLPSLEAVARSYTSVQHRVRMGVMSASGWCGSHCVFVAAFLAVMPVVVIATPPDAAATALQVIFNPWPRASPCAVIPATAFEPAFSKYFTPACVFPRMQGHGLQHSPIFKRFR